VGSLQISPTNGAKEKPTRFLGRWQCAGVIKNSVHWGQVGVKRPAHVLLPALLSYADVIILSKGITGALL